MHTTAASLLAKIQNRTARAGVVGLGYVGLPLAVEFARSGLRTTGIDLDRRKVDEVNAGTAVLAGRGVVTGGGAGDDGRGRR